MTRPPDVGGPSPPLAPPRAARRDPYPVVIGLVLVAATATGFVFAAAHPGLTCSCPEVSIIAVHTTTATAIASAAGHAYTFMITGLSTTGETFGQFSYWFSSALGGNVAPGPDWTVSVASASGNFTSGIAPQTQQLTGAGAVPVTVGANVTVFTGSVSLDGGVIVLDGNVGATTGLSTVPIGY